MPPGPPVRPAFRSAHRSNGIPHAFTLVEVVLSIGILTIALIGIFVLAQTGLNNYRRVVNVNIASSIGQQAVAQCLLANYDDLEKVLPLLNSFDERGVPVPQGEEEKTIYASWTERIPEPTQGIAESQVVRVKVTVTSPSQPDFKKIFVAIIARQEGKGH